MVLNRMIRPISSEVAKCPMHGKLSAMRLLAILSAFTLSAAAQTDERPLPPKNGEPPHRDGERRGDGEHRGGPPSGMMGGGGGNMMRPPYGMEKLSEDEKKLMREAFSKAWSLPEVAAARERALHANEEMRRVLHDAMKQSDPKIAAVLEKMKPPFPIDQQGFPELPKPDSPEFAKIASARLGAEMMSVARPGKHEDSRRFHDRIMQLPRIKEAFIKLDQTSPEARMEAFRKLRELYRQIAGEEFAKIRDERAASEGIKKAPEPKP